MSDFTVFVLPGAVCAAAPVPGGRSAGPGQRHQQGRPGQGGAGRDPRPAALLHEEQRVQATTTCSSRSMETTSVEQTKYKSVACMLCKPFGNSTSCMFDIVAFSIKRENNQH